MKIRTFHLHFTIPTGGYADERVGFSVDIDDDSEIENIAASLRTRACLIVGKTADQIYMEKHIAEMELKALIEKLEGAKRNYTLLRDFLSTQGIKDDLPEFPAMLVDVAATKVSVESKTDVDGVPF